jgi:uncharacterized integral membrane protein
MIYLKRFAALAVLVLIGLFVALNQNELGRTVPIHFFRLEASLILGFWLVIAFAAGVALILAVDFPRDLALRRDLRRKNSEIAQLKSEVERLLATAAPPETGRLPEA